MRLPDGAHHRTATGTLAHRLNDDAHQFWITSSRGGSCCITRTGSTGVKPSATLTIESSRKDLLYARADEHAARRVRSVLPKRRQVS